jgi:hypothetical protein
MSWPTSTTPTTYVDADTDPIWRARPHIKQDIENVNAIIDTFDPSTPSGGSISGEVAKLVDESDYADPDDNNIGAMPDIRRRTPLGRPCRWRSGPPPPGRCRPTWRCL